MLTVIGLPGLLLVGSLASGPFFAAPGWMLAQLAVPSMAVGLARTASGGW